VGTTTTKRASGEDMADAPHLPHGLVFLNVCRWLAADPEVLHSLSQRTRTLGALRGVDRECRDIVRTIGVPALVTEHVRPDLLEWFARLERPDLAYVACMSDSKLSRYQKMLRADEPRRAHAPRAADQDQIDLELQQESERDEREGMRPVWSTLWAADARQRREAVTRVLALGASTWRWALLPLKRELAARRQVQVVGTEVMREMRLKPRDLTGCTPWSGARGAHYYRREECLDVCLHVHGSSAALAARIREARAASERRAEARARGDQRRGDLLEDAARVVAEQDEAYERGSAVTGGRVGLGLEAAAVSSLCSSSSPELAAPSWHAQLMATSTDVAVAARRYVARGTPALRVAACEAVRAARAVVLERTRWVLRECAPVPSCVLPPDFGLVQVEHVLFGGDVDRARIEGVRRCWDVVRGVWGCVAPGDEREVPLEVPLVLSHVSRYVASGMRLLPPAAQAQAQEQEQEQEQRVLSRVSQQWPARVPASLARGHTLSRRLAKLAPDQLDQKISSTRRVERGDVITFKSSPMDAPICVLVWDGRHARPLDVSPAYAASTPPGALLVVDEVTTDGGFHPAYWSSAIERHGFVRFSQAFRERMAFVRDAGDGVFRCAVSSHGTEWTFASTDPDVQQAVQGPHCPALFDLPSAERIALGGRDARAVLVDAFLRGVCPEARSG
jgi:hypothetical protein